MAKHSHWANIKHKKGINDKKKGAVIAKMGKLITIAVSLGGPKLEENPRLRLAVDKARSAKMNMDAIERAIKKAAGSDGENYDAVRYEGYGPGGVAVIVEALTDNRNRTASNVRALFTKYAGNLGESGSVAFMFGRAGEISYKAAKASADAMLEAAIDAGADDVHSDADGHTIVCAFESIGEVSAALAAKFGEAETVKVVWKPQTLTPLDQEKAESLMKLLEGLDDDDDVQSVFSNADISDEVMAKLDAA